MSKLTDKLEIRNEAQDKLMYALQTAMSVAAQDDTSKEVFLEMGKQFSRIEKMFGYAAGSWIRGV